jgi:hypothetical protein
MPDDHSFDARTRALWLELQRLDLGEWAKAIADTLARMNEAEGIVCLGRLIMVDERIADLVDPRGDNVIPVTFRIRVEGFLRRKARERERHELAAAVADELESRGEAARRNEASMWLEGARDLANAIAEAHSLPENEPAPAQKGRPPSEGGTPKGIEAEDDQLLAGLMNDYSGDMRLVKRGFLAKLDTGLQPKTQLNRFYAALSRFRDKA